MLPDALQFLKLGWWVIHGVAIVLLYLYAYRRGVRDGRRSTGAPPSSKSQKETDATRS
jgi:hypothetical protein